MNILHISNDYGGSKVHSNLTIALDSINGIHQHIYCPVRDSKLIGANQFSGKNIEFKYSYIIKPWHKFLYPIKQKTLFEDIQKHIDLSSIDIIHATTLFSDGGVAYSIKKKFGIPYIVAVRNTDIYYFARLQPYLWRFGRKILMNANKIIFISKAHHREFCDLPFTRPILESIRDKVVLQPNGIDSFWLNNIDRKDNNGVDVLYIGDFTQNKNVIRLIHAVKLLRGQDVFKEVKLTIIGGGKDYKNKTINVINDNLQFVNYLGPIYDKKILKEQMRAHAVFAMPSLHETFGLVYIEALSQNLPVIYSNGQGIDGLFDCNTHKIGESVTSTSVDSIANGLMNILLSKGQYSNKDIDFNNFDWHRIAMNYYKLYNEAIK